MRKMIAFAFALFAVAAFAGEARAQLPFPGQSMPVEDNIDILDYPGINQVPTHEVGLYHHGNPVGNPPTWSYYLWADNFISKRNNDGTWTLVYFHGGFNSYANASAASPNLTYFRCNNLDVGDQYGTGQYRVGINFFAYNPITNVKIFLTQISNGFTVN